MKYNCQLCPDTEEQVHGNLLMQWPVIGESWKDGK